MSFLAIFSAHWQIDLIKKQRKTISLISLELVEFPGFSLIFSRHNAFLGFPQFPDLADLL